jgi:PAS domain S-box-containing protein
MKETPSSHILIVEDDESMASSMALMLRKKLSAEVTFATDCAQAREIYEHDGIDLVTVDYQLPDGDGIDLLAEFTSREGHPPVILVTGQGDETTAARSMEAGAAGYVIKDRLLSSTLFQAARRALDMSEAEKSIKASEARYRFLAENMHDMMWTSDLDLKPGFVSPSVTRVLGYPIEKWVELPLEDKLTEESLERARNRLADELEHDKERKPARTSIIEVDYRHAEGGTRCLETSLSFLRNGQGTPVGLYGLSRDVSKRKSVERALQESEELFRTMAQVATDAIVVIDSAGRVDYWNPAAESIFGYSSDEITGVEITPLLSAPAQLDANLEAVRNFGQTGIGPMFGKSHQFPSVDKEGRIVPVEVSSAPFMTGGEWRAVLNIRDITERVKAEETIRRNAAELKDLIDVAAHELRHPATIFKGYASILMRYGNDLDSDMARDAIDAIDRAADRLTVLINKLFDTSSVEHGGLTLDLSKVRPGLLLEEAVERARANGVTNVFKCDCGKDDWEITVDRQKMSEVLNIIIENAVTHSRKGTEIDCSCERDDGGTLFKISDRGPGVSEEARDLIFERFYQEEQAAHHSKPGLGLGLYIARAYIIAHGGWICMEPRAGGGSTFRFAVPDSQI